MLRIEWERHAEALARSTDDEQLAATVQQVAVEEGIRQGGECSVGAGFPAPANGGMTALIVCCEGFPGRVLLGHDTRPTSIPLLAAAIEGVKALGAEPVSLGLVTTPQLHFAVMEGNKGRPEAEDHYLETLAAAYREVVQGTAPLAGALVVDCANGVGAPKLRRLADLLRPSGLEVELRCTGEGTLNEKCGADYVQKEKALPLGFSQVSLIPLVGVSTSN